MNLTGWGQVVLLFLLQAPNVATPLPHAHAHNDYAHPRPLLDALAQGFCSVEADVFLTSQGELVVGHELKDLRPGRTLAALYLDPLKKRVRENSGSVYPGNVRFYLLIDIKSEARPTYTAIHALLAQYAEMLSEVRDEKVTQRAITVVISGNRPALVEMAKQSPRYAGYDGRLTDLSSDAPAHLMPWISDRWVLNLAWNGEGQMPDGQRKKLRTIVSQAHEYGRQVRFWATPEKPTVWRELRLAGVDWINTDRLGELREFFTRK